MLAKFIIANLEPIAADWHNYAKTCLPPAAEMTAAVCLMKSPISSRPSLKISEGRKHSTSKPQKARVNDRAAHWAVSLPPTLACASSRDSIWRK
jgi:hypothetical protein